MGLMWITPTDLDVTASGNNLESNPLPSLCAFVVIVGGDHSKVTVEENGDSLLRR